MKGLNALEIIFTLFVLIVVVLVVVRMFITRVTLTGIEKPVQDITETYNYEAAYSTCSSLCDKYEGDCGNTQNAVKFCIQKANIDIDGDRIAGEKGHFNVVEGIPLCEDGIYCFHVKTDCSCGTMRLNAETCLTILCDYYQHIRGYKEEAAARLIGNVVSYGTCPPDVTDWIGKIEDYEPVPIPKYDSVRNGEEVIGIRLMGPDHWWATAGYNTPCGIPLTTELSLTCEARDEGIRCSWQNCDLRDDQTIEVIKGKYYDEFPISRESGSKTLPVETDGEYKVMLDCENGFKIRTVSFD